MDASRNKINNILNLKQKNDALERLDLSYNKISSVDYLETLFPNIVCLDLSHNELLSTQEFRFMRGMYELSELNFKNNPIDTPE